MTLAIVDARQGAEYLERAGSPVGSLCQSLPRYARQPPVEAVVFAWGVNEDGQLGLPSEASVPTPKVVDTLLGVRWAGRTFGANPLVAGSRNTLALDTDGGLWSWGWNARGTLGLGHRGQVTSPQRIAALSRERIVQVAVNGWHCLAVNSNGQVFAWGGNEYMQCGVDADKRDIVTPIQCMPQLRVKMVACGGMHSLALTYDGEVWTWGEPWGDFSINVIREPRKVEGVSNIAAIAVGGFHNLALTKRGEVLSWGTNDYGQLGNGSTFYQTTPQIVPDLEHEEIADIAAGGWHSAALTTKGEVYIWGRGEYGRLGLGDRTGSSKMRPQKLKGLENHCVVQIELGGTHSVVLTSRGRIFIWGRGSYGRLGVGNVKDYYHPVELSLPGGCERWRTVAVSAGGRHTICLAVPVREGCKLDSEDSLDEVSEASLFDKDIMDGGSSPQVRQSSVGEEGVGISLVGWNESSLRAEEGGLDEMADEEVEEPVVLSEEEQEEEEMLMEGELPEPQPLGGSGSFVVEPRDLPSAEYGTLYGDSSYAGAVNGTLSQSPTHRNTTAMSSSTAVPSPMRVGSPALPLRVGSPGPGGAGLMMGMGTSPRLGSSLAATTEIGAQRHQSHMG